MTQSAENDAPPCCPGAGTMAHVRGCRNHPENPWIAFPGKVPVCQVCGADWRPVRRGECIQCGSDAGPKRLGADVTENEGAGSDGHESNEQPPQPVSQEPPVPGVQPEGGDHLRGESRHGVGGVPVVRVREHDGAADVATRCRSGRSVGPHPDAQRCGNFTRHPSGYCHHHRPIPPAKP